MKNTTIFKRLLGYLKAYRLRLFFVLLSAVISTAFTGIFMNEGLSARGKDSFL